MPELTPAEIEALELRSKKFTEMLTKAGKENKKRIANMKYMMRRRNSKHKGG